MSCRIGSATAADEVAVTTASTSGRSGPTRASAKPAGTANAASAAQPGRQDAPKPQARLAQPQTSPPRTSASRSRPRTGMRSRLTGVVHANPGTPELQPRRDLADHQGMSSLGSAASNGPASPAAVVSARSPKVTRSLPRSAEAHRAARQRHLVARGRSPLPDGLPFQGHLGRRGPAVPRPGMAPSTPEPHRGGRRRALPPIRLRANSGARDSCSSSRAAISGRSPESITARQKNAQRGRSGRWCRRRAVSTASAPRGSVERLRRGLAIHHVRRIRRTWCRTARAPNRGRRARPPGRRWCRRRVRWRPAGAETGRVLRVTGLVRGGFGGAGCAAADVGVRAVRRV